MNKGGAVALVRETFAAYGSDQVSRQAAALAYFTIFAIAPLIVVVMEIAALLMGAHGHTRQFGDRIIASIASSTGKQSAQALYAIVRATAAQAHREGIFAGIAGWCVLILAATGLFGAVQGSLDDIWHVGGAKRPLWSLLRDRFTSFIFVAGVALVLLLSIAANTGVAAAGNLPGIFREAPFLASALDFIISLIIVASLFASIFKFLPHVEVQWKDVLLGSAVSALLFICGQLALSWYLGRAGTASTFGAAGSLIVIVLWLYYSGQIFLLGAEFTKVYAHRHGSMSESGAAASDRPPV